MPRFLLLLLALALTAPASAFQYQRHTLSNGLTVLLYKDASVPLVAVNIWYKVGSKNEKPGRTGFAHLFEHYMFECTEHVKADEYFQTISRRLGGIANAFTSYDMTNYYAVVPSGGLDELLRLESSRMGFLRTCLNQKLLDKQRGIVQNEKRMREGQPYGMAFETAISQLVGPAHPYHWPIIGHMKDLEAATLKDVSDFHETYYQPNNAVLVIAGAIDEAQALARARFWFEGLARGAQPPALAAPAVSLGGRREGTQSDPKAQMPMLILAYPVPGKGKPGSNEAQALAAILAGGRGSRLQQALKGGPKPLALDLGAEIIGLHETDMLLVNAIPAPGVTLEQLEAAISAEMAKVAKDGISAAELSRLKARLRTSLYDGLQSVEGVARAMAEGEAVAGDPDAFLEGEIGAIEALTPPAIQAAAAKRLVPENSSALKILPEAKKP